MKSKTLVMIVLFSLSLAACGRDKVGNEKAFQQGAGDGCSEDFIADYNELVTRAQAIRTPSQLASAQALVERFEDEYRDVVCKDASQVYVDANDTVRKQRLIVERYRIILGIDLGRPSPSSTGRPSPAPRPGSQAGRRK